MGNYLIKYNLKKCTVENTPKYSFKNQTRLCKVLSIYDGDTITVAIKLEETIYKVKIRMYGYDSPELKPRKNIKNRDKIIISAKKAKKALEDKILNNIVKIYIYDFDKYGRLLGTIYKIHGKCMFKSYENINKYIIKNKYGYEYYGKTKLKLNLS